MDNRYHNFINWKSYYQDSQVKEYNLRNTYCVNLFNTNDLNMPGENQINYLNPYLGELVMMYYIWKNNFKSDYICISQYRRDFTYIDFDELDKGKIQTMYKHHNKDNFGVNLLYGYDPNRYCRKKLYVFLKKRYGLDDNDIKAIEEKSEYETFNVLTFAMKWDKFCEVCEFIFGYLEELLPNEGWKDMETLEKFRYDQTSTNEEKYNWPFNDRRYLVFVIEEVLGRCFGLFFDFFKNDNYEKNTVIYSKLEKGDKWEEIKTFYVLAIKTNPMAVVFKVTDDFEYPELFKSLYFEWQYPKLKLIKENEEILNEYGKVPEKIIELNIDEYIDVDHPIDLHEGRYNIKKIVY